MREEFEKLAAAGKLETKHIEALVALTTSGYCHHRSWGFGRIKAIDTVFSRFTIDFQTKAGHFMDLGFAAESLRPIPRDHILARKAGDIEALRQMAALHHLDLIKVVIQSFGGKATLEQIQQILVPDVITEDWRKWWEVAKKEMKKDGHFQIPLKKTEPIVFQAQETALGDRLTSDFRAAKGLKAKTVIANDALKSFTDIADQVGVATEIITGLNNEIATYVRNQPSVALEAVFVRDDLRAVAALAAATGEIGSASIWGQEPKFSQIFELISVGKHKRALHSFRDATALWHEAVLASINNLSAKAAGECASVLIQENRMAQLKETLAMLISRHSANSELLLWLAKERSDSFADILGPEVFRAMLTAIERDQFNEKKSNRLRDYIMDDQQLLVDLIGSADIEVIKDLTRALQLSPCFDDMDKRSLLARIVKSYPAVQTLISGEQSNKQDVTLVVSWASLERRKNEYNELVQKTIPANSKEIAIARSYGDLRENHEYKAAKEMQKILMRRKAELEAQLIRARGTDFAQARTDAVSIGTRVAVTNLTSQEGEEYTIMGAWDSAPEKNIISYLTPVGQAFLNKKQGETVDFELEGQKQSFRIEAIHLTTPPAASA
ncbi:MAG: GreA/GreB family elongation factor [Verrucomicrobia bacterium]|nr:GreA/GreB family elongation factor [Verrucomicrobiota bacterium]MBI3871329.1 GreA/GreB family elongation factor [Verrucomicrobiota bacterium]